MPVPASINDLSTTAGNNSPAGSESPTTTDDYLRAHAAFIATVRDSADAAYRKANILGTVSQTSGVPTGAIIERGSNANGEYVRFADGTQICRSPAISTTLSTASGSVFSNQGATPPTWTFPAVFSVPPQVSSLPGTNSTTWGSANAGETATNAILRIFASNSVGSTTVSGFAIGRWF